ncbi:MAG: glycogen/starch synthase [Saprospiraceae bacterium]|nr:glycogen/starch synthase [Saprospiraceae bacterium]
MADKKRILIVTQEMKPYTNISKMSEIVRTYSQYLQENGMEIRILMPRFGTINERRHRLHEVVRLSGMNINVNDEDYPLIIKVASLPGTRMQVYFLDNEEFFKRKTVFKTDSGELHKDNLDRTVFFCKGVIETVKKFGWSPDIVHCHGWMTSLLPAYLKTHYCNEPIFQNAQVVHSAYECGEINEAFNTDFNAQAKKNLLDTVVESYTNANNTLDLNKGAALHADGVVLNDSIELDLNGAPNITHDDEATAAYLEFFKELFVTTEA